MLMSTGPRRVRGEFAPQAVATLPNSERLRVVEGEVTESVVLLGCGDVETPSSGGE